MKKNSSNLYLIAIICTLTLSCSVREKKDGTGSKHSFDSAWRFIKADPANAQDPDFDDSGWRSLDLPHDWSIEKLTDKNSDSLIGPFSGSSVGKTGTGFTVGGTGWYRKNFTLDRSSSNKIAYLQFDGVYMDADVWVNGKHVGNHPNGYTSFWYDISAYLNPAGQPNMVAIRVSNEGFTARWYSGSGIYRHTWLTLADPVHIAPKSVFVNPSVVDGGKAVVDITATLLNRGKENKEVDCSVTILDSSGQKVGYSRTNLQVSTGHPAALRQSIEIERPQLWSPDRPYRYTALIAINAEDENEDRIEQAFGIRTIQIDAQSGFRINGKKIKLKGGSIHHDNGLLGAVALDRAEERKIELLKANGYNAIRLSHNPSSPYLLEVCDRLGMLVIDELYDVWEREKFMPQGYHLFFRDHWEKDVEEWISTNRNHPSVVMWSIGNEIMEAADTSGFRIAQNLAAKVRSLDPSRPVTEGMNDMKGIFSGKDHWDEQAGHMGLLDVVGYNYKSHKYESDHKKYPQRVMYGSESYPLKAYQYWEKSDRLPYVIGDFVWTAMDYLGEANAGNTKYVSINAPKEKSITDMVNEGVPMDVIASFAAAPVKLPAVFVSGSGDLDITGEKKPPMYYRDVLWDNSPVEMLVHAPIADGMLEQTTDWGWPDEWPSWTWQGSEGKKLQVRVFTKGDRVKLELNGKLIGESPVSDRSEFIAAFQVPYQAGELKATAYSKGKEIGSRTLRSAGRPVAVRLTADRSEIRPDRNDLSFIKVEVVDQNGLLVPTDGIKFKFSLSGEGELAATGNGNPVDMESVNSTTVASWKGRAQAIIRPNGKKGLVTLKASADNISEGRIQILIKE
ncbi:glycoside hydrolase family 2 TIM barrel-domain containing protein [Myroides ceti]|uniref:Glycoside hydrolase family 2 TIM barrel-domain containing protein n=1 Tax=Paenimyroides ceti TaxID=395087 RepID=A0ABT8CU42_9FLAO|nr:glycoside hydrolase family 2 TIM barrel-domain containing protein [Paenimyroides ceti]MDN3706717.1 glycoside hydrolase family 2 TIM barrel-domain containing protein [Paenimyroides ceti]